MDYQDFSRRIKSKYPEYNDMDDRDLAQRMVAKFPGDYSDVTFDQPQIEQPAPIQQKLDPSSLFAPGQMASSASMTGQVLNALEGVSALGRKAAEGWGKLGGLVGPKTEKAASVAAGLILPQDKVSAAMAMASIAGELEKGIKAVPTIAKAARKIPALAGKIPQDVAAVSTQVIKPSVGQRAIGSAISSTTAIPERYTSAVVADTSILSDATPSMKAVSNEYSAVFKRLGEKFDSKLFQKYINRNYIPADNEAQALNKNVLKVISKLEDNLPVSPAEALLARSQAAALERSNRAAINGTLKRFASESKNAFDDYLMENGVPEIKQLSAKYFRAVAKEHFESMLPRNKNMSPNALRGVIMAKIGTDALGHMVSGEPLKAAGKALQAAGMSPLLVGKALRNLPDAAPFLRYLGGQVAAKSAKQENGD